ncbi:MAG: purine-nucleoside phosphorylase [Ignavibacteria bacterium]|nr:purine-nucleoside phosphorylase [Ignavibacteria bacterium]
MKFNNKLKLAIILGSGVELNKNVFLNKQIIKEENEGVHLKQVYICKCGSDNILVFKGRKHFYEGFKKDEISGNIKFAAEMGIDKIFITNAAGGLNENFNAGDLMLITSHINFLTKIVNKPVSHFYDENLMNILRKCCIKNKIKLHEGTYGCYSGPTYETKAEIRFQKNFMLDAAGMSTVPEVLYASDKGLRVVAVSIITNLLKENEIAHISHNEVLSTASAASQNLNIILPCFISELN